MNMTKIAIHSCDLPQEDLACKRFRLDLMLELAECIIDGKIKAFDVQKINHNTWQREWRDQQSVEEFYEYFKNLFVKYGGTLHYVKILDKGE